MPNWCDNELDVFGPGTELQRFVDATKYKEGEESGYALKHLYPCPQELVDTVAGFMQEGSDKALALAKQEVSNMEKYGHKNWYDWAYSNWGTKWGDCEFDWSSNDGETVKVEPTDLCIGAHYQTAWGPADGLIRNISGQFPTLHFSVVSTEESDAFACFSIFHNGELVAEGGLTPEMPAEVVKAFDGDKDEAYGLLDDWRCQYSDAIRDEASTALNRLIPDAKIPSGAKP